MVLGAEYWSSWWCWVLGVLGAGYWGSWGCLVRRAGCWSRWGFWGQCAGCQVLGAGVAMGAQCWGSWGCWVLGSGVSGGAGCWGSWGCWVPVAVLGGGGWGAGQPRGRVAQSAQCPGPVSWPSVLAQCGGVSRQGPALARPRRAGTWHCPMAPGQGSGGVWAVLGVVWAVLGVVCAVL